jgi:hypothetical protein
MRSAGRRVGDKTSKAARAAKSPLGKLAIVQAAAVLGLFAYVVVKMP